MSRNPERDAAGNLDADHPRAYHRRVSEQLDRAGNCDTACGRKVNYQQTMNSWDDVDCRGCLATLPRRQLSLDLDEF
jgi:hypothetical protein